MLNSIHFKNYFLVIVLGDFSYPGIDWVDGTGFVNSVSGDEQAFSNLLMDHYLFQLVDTPTRLNNVLDLVFTNAPASIGSVETGVHMENVGLPSDHLAMVFDIEVSSLFKVTKRYRYDFGNVDFESMDNALSLLPLSDGIQNVKSQEEYDSHWELWCDLVFASINSFVPKVS